MVMGLVVAHLISFLSWLKDPASLLMAQSPFCTHYLQLFIVSINPDFLMSLLFLGNALAFYSGLETVKPLVMVDWQVGGIWNHRGDLHLSVSVRAFAERFVWGGMTHHDCKQHNPMGWVPELNKRKKENWSPISPRFPCSLSLIPDCRCSLDHLPHVLVIKAGLTFDHTSSFLWAVPQSVSLNYFFFLPQVTLSGIPSGQQAKWVARHQTKATAFSALGLTWQTWLCNCFPLLLCHRSLSHACTSHLKFSSVPRNLTLSSSETVPPYDLYICNQMCTIKN